MSDLVKWPADVDEVIHGDLTVAAAYSTPAGGAVAVAVAPCGIGQREGGASGIRVAPLIAAVMRRPPNSRQRQVRF
jgi:hypothetical protein